MPGIFSRISITSILLTTLAATGCGGGSDSASSSGAVYSGLTTPAAIDAGNVDTFGLSSTEGTVEAINVNNVPFAVSINTADYTELVQQVEDIARGIADTSPNLGLPLGVVLTDADLNALLGTSQFCGGSVTAPDNFGQGGSISGTLTFNAVCVDDGVTTLTMSGPVIITDSASGITMQFANFIVSSGGNSETINATLSCDANLSNCSLASDFAGMDGTVYRISDISVTGNAASGHYVNLSFYHPSFGQASVTTTSPITTGSCGLFPDAGGISVFGANGSYFTMDFNNDCSYSISGFDGTVSIPLYTANWP